MLFPARLLGVEQTCGTIAFRNERGRQAHPRGCPASRPRHPSLYSVSGPAHTDAAQPGRWVESCPTVACWPARPDRPPAAYLNHRFRRCWNGVCGEATSSPSSVGSLRCFLPCWSLGRSAHPPRPSPLALPVYLYSPSWAEPLLSPEYRPSPIRRPPPPPLSF